MSGIPGSRKRFSLRRLLLALAVAYGAIYGVLWLGVDQLAFVPPPPGYALPDPDIVVLEEHGVPDLALRYYPGPPGAPVLLMSHGNAEDLGRIEPYQRAVAERGVAVCAWDYPGYGASGGDPDLAETERGIRRVHRWLVGAQGVAPGRIVLWGRSLGTGPSCWLLRREPVAGLVLESGFTSLHRILTTVPLFPVDPWDNLDAVADSTVPVLVVHGERDEVIPASHGRALAAAAGTRAETLFQPDVGHNDPADSERIDAIVAFARRCVGR